MAPRRDPSDHAFTSQAPLAYRALAQVIGRRKEGLTAYVRGTSMWPTLRPGDRCVVVPTTLQAIRPGDIVVYHCDDGTPIAHRVIQQRGTSILTRGDNRWRADPPVRAEQVLGVVVAATRGDRAVPLHTRGAKARLYCRGLRLLVMVRRLLAHL